MASEAEDLRARVVLLEKMVVLLCAGRAHDLSWSSFYYSKYFCKAETSLDKLRQYEKAWDAKMAGEPGTTPPGYAQIMNDD